MVDKSFLILLVGGQRYALPHDRADRVDFVGDLSPLPLATGPIEGLTTVDGVAVVQIDAAAALGLNAEGPGRRVTIAVGSGAVALRVDAVIGRTAEPGATPLLPLAEILRAINDAAADLRIDRLPPAARPNAESGVELLLVVAGETRAALLLAGIDRVVEVDTVHHLAAQNGAIAEVAMIAGRPLPARSLAGSAAPRFGVIGRVDGTVLVLLVDRIVRLRRVPLRQMCRIARPGGPPILCCANEEGAVIAVHQFGALASATATAIELLPLSDQPEPDLIMTNARGGATGLRVRVGAVTLVLPLALVVRVMPADALGKASLAPLPAGRSAAGPDRLPVFDGGRMLGGAGTTGGIAVVIAGPDCNRAILLVDQVGLDHGLAAAGWRTLPLLPAAVAGLFDGIRYEPAGWVLRVNTDALSAKRLTRTARRAIVAARLGWTDPVPKPV